MGKTIISQARGHGSLTYRVRRKAFSFRIKYPKVADAEGEVVKLVHSAGHSAPLAKIKIGDDVFYNPAAIGLHEGQKVKIGHSEKLAMGDIVRLKDLPTKVQVYNIESRPGDGGKFIRTGGTSAVITNNEKGVITLIMPSKQEKVFNGECRATIGVIAGSGRADKPVVKAGKMFHIKKAKGNFWPRTSAVKVNAIDHPFGSGRGKNLTHGRLGKIPRRNAPPGANVGSIRAKRTGRGKGGK